MTLDMTRQPELAIPFQSTKDILKKWNKRDSKKKAIVDLDQQEKHITWGELATEADRIAVLLSEMGVKSGDKIAVLSDENLEKLTLWMGIWRYGAVICPLNVEMNEQHLIEILSSINPVATFVHTNLNGLNLPTAFQKSTFEFDSWKRNIAGNANSDELFERIASKSAEEGSQINNGNEAEDLACIFCTSGTTSKPKSVVYNHMSYWLSGLSTLDMLGLTENDRTLEYRSFGWNSAQILSLMPWLQTGLTMHIATRFSRQKFFDWIQKHKITFSAGVPTVVNMLLNDPPPAEKRNVPSLRLMTCSTAPLSPDQWTKFENLYKVKLLQLYGMSEAGWICGNRHYRREMGTVGPAAKHQELIIVDPNGNPCPTNVEGEITVGGPQTCQGTISITGDFEDLSKSRIATGDLGVFNKDGFVTVTGRTKDLIIRGGVNIAPLEVDNILLKHPNIREAATIGIPDKIYGEEVMAFISLMPGVTVSANEVIEWCNDMLPQFKSPKHIRFIENLPKSDRGKVLREELKSLWLKLTPS